ncbi:YjcZ family sporulation protein [Oceanobacillus saliphilus]|uniref:YjcZ family sporulation protein n=1 Tax=Oceanobacillus saliphilus TaxID=2925834 RepID=UPI0027D220AD|nr:YjcZ family sporulation protein [Oceanobacillus saliphilus]
MGYGYGPDYDVYGAQYGGCGYSGPVAGTTTSYCPPRGASKDFVLIIVLFILLIIVGAAWL